MNVIYLQLTQYLNKSVALHPPAAAMHDQSRLQNDTIVLLAVNSLQQIIPYRQQNSLSAGHWQFGQRWHASLIAFHHCTPYTI